MAIITLGKIVFPLTIILSLWLVFEIIEFFRLGGGAQPLAWCIVKISVITSTIIGLSSENVVENSVNNEFLLEKIKTLAIAQK